MLVFQLSKAGHVVSCNRMIQLRGLNHIFGAGRPSAPKQRRIAGRRPRSRMPIRASGYYSVHPAQQPFDRADPAAAFGAGYGAEEGNRMHFGLLVLGNGTQFSISELSFAATSTDPGNALAFGYAGGYGYSTGYVGLNYGPDGIKGTADDFLVTSGPNTQLVDELYGRGSGNSFAAYADKRLALSARQACRVHRELNSGTGEFASDSPDLPPIPKVALLELPAGGPSTCAIGRANNGTPVGAPVHRRSDADWLAGCASDQNLEAIADLKISANGTARIEETHEWTLGGCRNNSQNQEEWDPHNSPIRVHSNRAMYWPRIPAGSRAAFRNVISAHSADRCRVDWRYPAISVAPQVSVPANVRPRTERGSSNDDVATRDFGRLRPLPPVDRHRRAITAARQGSQHKGSKRHARMYNQCRPGWEHGNPG